MSKLFSRGSSSHVKKNVFDLSHERKLSMNMGDLVPFYLQEVVPGDKFKVSSEQLIRLAPMLAPMMHRVNVFTHYFFVPNRLVYDAWQDFITGGSDSTLSPAFPVLEINEANKMWFNTGQLPDYFGIPTFDPNTTTVAGTTKINALPFRAYNLIWNEYFRDQTLQPALEFSTGETVPTEDYPYLCNLKKRCWEKDYFTSALPWAQRGPDVMIPTLPAIKSMNVGYKPITIVKSSATGAGVSQDAALYTNSLIDGQGVHPGSLTNQSDQMTGLFVDNIDGVSGSLATATGSINDLRKAARLQEWFEKNARAGARYVEQIMAHFGVRSSDARLQRPEFLGGGINPIVISEVLSTYGTTEVPQGNMSGHGISVGHDNHFNKFFEEHGYVIGIMSVLPRTGYQQGIPKAFLKTDKYEFFWPEFAQIGEQPVADAELYYDPAVASDQTQSVFGYQSRYAEYKFAPNTVHGDFRTNMAYWHMGRQFSNKPSLNASFVQSDPTHRAFAVTDPTEHKLYVQIYNKVTAIRPMPVFNVPQL